MTIRDAQLAKYEVRATEKAKQVAEQWLARARDRPGFGNGRDVHDLVNRARASEKKRAKEVAERTGNGQIAPIAAVQL